MKTIRGNRLEYVDQVYVLAAYIYRNTVENLRAHPDCVRQAGGSLPPITDARWLEITDFVVKNNGHLDGRVRSCTTHHHEVPEWAAIIDDWASKKAA